MKTKEFVNPFLKILLSTLAILIVSVSNANGQNASKMDVHIYVHNEKGHACGPECKNIVNTIPLKAADNTVYAHGENGHACGPECKNILNTAPMNVSDTKVYAHGENGHACGPECKNIIGEAPKK